MVLYIPNGCWEWDFWTINKYWQDFGDFWSFWMEFLKNFKAVFPPELFQLQWGRLKILKSPWMASLMIHHMGSFFVWRCSERHCFYKMLSRFNSNREIYIVHFAKHESMRSFIICKKAWKENGSKSHSIGVWCIFTYLFSIQSNQSWIGKYVISSHGWVLGF